MVPKRIVVMGASTAEGRVDPEHGGFAGRLRAWHEAANDHHHVYNLGISGDTVLGMIQRLQRECAPRRPGLIILTTGLNDTMRMDSRDNPTATCEEAFREQVKTLIRQSLSLAETVVVSPVPMDEAKTSPVGWGSYHYLLSDARTFTGVTKAVCTDVSVPYLDVFSDWLDHGYGELLSSDGLHPNARGHELIFTALRDMLLKLYS